MNFLRYSVLMLLIPVSNQTFGAAAAANAGFDKAKHTQTITYVDFIQAGAIKLDDVPQEYRKAVAHILNRKVAWADPIKIVAGSPARIAAHKAGREGHKPAHANKLGVAAAPAAAVLKAKPVAPKAQEVVNHKKKNEKRDAAYPKKAAQLGESYAVNKKYYSPDQQAVLKDMEQCQTLFGTANASSACYRELAYYAARNCGFTAEQAHLVGIVNGIHEPNACAVKSTLNKESIIYINFNEEYWNKRSLGRKIFALHHEMQHLKLRHYKENEEQIHEYQADKAAALAVGCAHCCRETVAEYLTFNELAAYKHYTLALLDPLATQEIELVRDKIAQISIALGGTHPLPLERALRIYLYSKLDVNKDKTCKYHNEKYSKQIHNANLKELIKEEARLKAYIARKRAVEISSKVTDRLKAVQKRIAEYQKGEKLKVAVDHAAADLNKAVENMFKGKD